MFNNALLQNSSTTNHSPKSFAGRLIESMPQGVIALNSFEMKINRLFRCMSNYYNNIILLVIDSYTQDPVGIGYVYWDQDQ